MTEEKIIEILHRYNSFYHGETLWFFSKEEILDFAQALIRERFAEDAYVISNNLPHPLNFEVDYE